MAKCIAESARIKRTIGHFLYNLSSEKTEKKDSHCVTGPKNLLIFFMGCDWIVQM